MGEARFEVALRERDDGYGSRGRELVEFLIAPNPGLPFGPLREVASGGELSRVMLALLSVAHGAETAAAGKKGAKRARAGKATGAIGGDGDGSLLVFDEIDAGIGGHTARAVGAHLRELAEGRQVSASRTCRRSPQWATATSRSSRTPRNRRRPRRRGARGDAVVGELVRMLGADEGGSRPRGDMHVSF